MFIWHGAAALVNPAASDAPDFLRKEADDAAHALTNQSRQSADERWDEIDYSSLSKQ
jgi:hypothetical protein